MTPADHVRIPVTSTSARKAGLGRGLMTALVISSMIGSGVFSLPQNMAAKAGPLAIIIGWAITGVGMLALAFVYQGLATRKPHLDAGPYSYAKAGFGDFIGFNSAWGYWLSAWIGNVSYAVILFSALSYFVPAFGEGNTLAAIVGASAVLWAVHALLLVGVREAAVTNLVTTIAKVAPILMFIALVAVAFNMQTFNLDFSGLENPGLGSVMEQVKGTMLVTLWVFIGIEGASVVSRRASNRKDIGFSTMAGFLVCLVLYAAVSVISLGIMPQAELAALKNPSMAGVLEKVVGPWGAILINLALVVSVLGAFLSWTLLAAEIPYEAAKDGSMPKFFCIENAKGSPSASLWITNLLVQIFLLVTYFANSTYMALFSIASVAILVPYAFSAAYAFKLAMGRESYAAGESTGRDLLTGGIATLYGVWLVYASDIKYLFMCAALYAAGILVFAYARQERGEKWMTPAEAVFAVLLASVGVAAVYMMWTGAISPL